MAGKTFVDTDVFVYLFDRANPDKQHRARRLIDELGPTVVLSTQVLQEFYVAVTRKLAKPLSPSDAAAVVGDLSALEVVIVDVPLMQRAIASSQTHHLSLWDALIVESARASGAERLVTEYLPAGRRFGRLRVENPFET